jgi:hypothetical protein
MSRRTTPHLMGTSGAATCFACIVAGKGAGPIKLILWFGAAVLAAGALLGSGQVAAAQADRTLGIGCTYAGHEHCGENSRIGGARRYGLLMHHHRPHPHHHYARY